MKIIKTFIENIKNSVTKGINYYFNTKISSKNQAALINMNLNSRGQAALVDSLFFIAIVSTVCTGLFYFAINYGTSSETVLNSFYSSDFAMDSLKVLTYVSVFRDGRAISALDKVEAKSAEFDYLLALIKEDYAKSPTNVDALSLNTRKAIANTLHSVLLPFDTSLDYVFFIEKEGYKPGEGSFLTMIIATKKCYSNCNPQDPPENRVIKRVYFSCNPSKSNVLEKLVFPNAGKVDSAIGKIMLSKDTSGHATNYVLALHMWVSKKIGAISEIVRTSDLPLDQHEPDFRCELLSEFG